MAHTCATLPSAESRMASKVGTKGNRSSSQNRVAHDLHRKSPRRENGARGGRSWGHLSSRHDTLLDGTGCGQMCTTTSPTWTSSNARDSTFTGRARTSAQRRNPRHRLHLYSLFLMQISSKSRLGQHRSRVDLRIWRLKRRRTDIRWRYAHNHTRCPFFTTNYLLACEDATQRFFVMSAT